MRMLQSYDMNTLVNVDNVHDFHIEMIDGAVMGYALMADEVDLSYHINIKDAQSKLQELARLISTSESFVYRMESTS